MNSEEEDDDCHGSDGPPSRADSDRKDLSDCDEQEVVVSDEEVPKQDVLDKLTRLATQFSQTVEKLRRKADGTSNASMRSDQSSKSIPSSHFTPPLDSEEQVPCTQADDDEEFEKDSISSSQTGRKKY